MNPLSGILSWDGQADFDQDRTFITPAKDYMPNTDWVLIIRKEEWNKQKKS